jgi:cyclophilin family peptidyl-prolyl cis-trans isomerase
MMKRLFGVLGAMCLLVAFGAGAQTPAILSEPQSVTVNNASAATFTVAATNAAAYQWFFQGTQSLAGATNATLSLDDVGRNQAGSYTVVVTSSSNLSVTSAPPAVLTIVPGTIILWTISTYPGGGGSNFLVQLFDHDKPATVENFIHYIAAGAYSNTFFDRDVTNFVLQGGDYFTSDRTTNGLNVNPIVPGTNFPSQVDSEFGLGPLIHNRFGTLAMALAPGETNSATSAFFFNLADNSTNLDPQAFTVFGRIIAGSNASQNGTNILQYFNTLSPPSNGIFTDFSATPPLPIPVNDDATNAPTDANLFYCDFQFISPTNPPVITNLPTVSITFPAPNADFTNVSELTFTGTASENGGGLAEVFCVVSALTGLFDGESGTNAAIGTTNWSEQFGDLEPGIYSLTAYAQDGAGHLSAPATVFFTNLAVLTIITNVAGELSTNMLYLMPGQQYSVTAEPGAGEKFVNWQNQGELSFDPVQTFTAETNFTLEVTFLSTNVSMGLTITSPNARTNALSIQYVLTVSGTFAATNVTQLTCQFFLHSNTISGALPAAIAGTNWSLTVTNYANGSNYLVLATAVNAEGQESFASASFTLVNVEVLTLKTNGGGTIVNTNSRSYGEPYVAPGAHTVKAVPAKGSVFYSWNDGVTTTLNPALTFQIVSNLTLTATFVPEDTSLTGLAITYPPANAMLTNGALLNVAGTLPASPAITNLTCQLFLQSNGLTALPQPVILDATGTKWSFPVSNLTAGAYSILAVGYDTKGYARLVSEKFNLLTKLVVNVQGQGTVTAGLNGKYFEVGKEQTITATPKAGQIFAFWNGAVANTNSATTTFVISTNMVLTANFVTNPFPPVAGTYTGLFFDPAAVTTSNAGFITVTITATGSFSGKLMFPAITYPITYAFPYNGVVTLQARNAFDSNYLDLLLSLDSTNGAGAMTGVIADQTSSGTYLWVDDMVLHRSVTNISGSNLPAAGNYVLLVRTEEDASNGPAATGYAAVSLAANGALALAGALPDNTAIAQSAKMSQDGIWPVYVVPSSYKGKGMVMGWQTNTPSGACEGQLFWCKPGARFASNLTSSGAAFAAPLAGTQYQMALPGGTTNALPVSSARQFVAQSNIVSISLLSTGVLSGYVEVNKTKLAFKGAFIDPTNGGAGFLIEAGGQTEGFQILPQP